MGPSELDPYAVVKPFVNCENTTPVLLWAQFALMKPEQDGRTGKELLWS